MLLSRSRVKTEFSTMKDEGVARKWLTKVGTGTVYGSLFAQLFRDGHKEKEGDGRRWMHSPRLDTKIESKESSR